MQDADVAAAWNEEISRRLAEVDAGKVTPIPWQEARARIFAAALGQRAPAVPSRASNTSA